MAKRPRRSNAAASVAADAVLAMLHGGVLEIYDGQQPESADQPLTDQRVLAAVRFGDPAFAPAVNGAAEAHPLTEDPSAQGTGDASWFRTFSRTGQAVFDGSVGKTGANLNLPILRIQAGMRVAIEAFTYTEGKT